MDNGKGSGKRKGFWIFVTIIGLLVVFMASSAAWTHIGANISRQDAMEIAISHVGGGTAATPDLDWSIWRWLWYIEVWHDGLVHEVYMHPSTGAVVRHEIDILILPAGFPQNTVTELKLFQYI